MKKNILIVLVSLGLLSASCINEEARIQNQVESQMRENDEKVRQFSSKQNLDEAKRLLQTDTNFYYAKKHLQAISANSVEYPEAQKLLEEIKINEAKQDQVRKQNSTQLPLTKSIEESIEYKLACLNKGSTIDKDDITVNRFRYLLNTIERKTQNTQQQIADMTYKSQEVMRGKYGKDFSLLEIMEQANRAMPDNSNHIFKYEEVVSNIIPVFAK